jgi:PAS domain S-box-containing protein
VVSTSPPRVAIPWHRRFQARVLIVATLVAGVSLFAVLFATSRAITRSSLDRSGSDLEAARAAFNVMVYASAQVAADKTRLITELPTFRALLSPTGFRTDTATLDEMTKEYCGKLDATFCAVNDAEGRQVGSAGSSAAQTVPGVLAVTMDVARTGQYSVEIVSSSDGLFLVVSQPALFGQEVLGTFTAGFRLDDAVATELSLVTHCDVNFICAGNQVCASTLPARVRPALQSLAAQHGPDPVQISPAPARYTLGETTYVGATYALTSRLAGAGGRVADTARLVLLQDWTPAERALAAIRGALLWIGLVTFGVAVLGTLVFTRHMTRPLSHLADVANEVAGGNWTRRVPVAGPAEARMMAEAFNHMTVTLSHWHEEARTRALQLHDSNEQFRSVTDSANDAIVSVNSRGEIVFWNLCAQTVFGYDEHDALGLAFVELIPERHRAEYAQAIDRLRSGYGPQVGNTIELSARRRDGSEVPVELSLSTWKAGNEVFYTGVVRDITERKQAAEALRQREEQLRHSQKLEAVGRLAGGIAHDFNNLLTAILGYADLLLEELPPGHQHRADIEGIQKAGRTAASLTRDLLAFSRKHISRPVVLDLNDVIAGTEHLLRRLVTAEIELVTALEPGLPPIRMDRVLMEQVLMNLTVNARDAMPSGGLLTIGTAVADIGDSPTLPGSSPGRHVVLTVSDTGHGMTAEVKSHLFEPFFTTKELGKGTGLGLATVYGIVQQSGGYIEVESEPGQGAAFHIYLPAVVGTERTDRAEPETAELARGGSETVLLVEDNESVREVARETLDRLGYRVLEATSGQDALDIAAHHRGTISVVVTDVSMPSMSGRELAERLTSRHPRLKIVFMSGYTDDASVQPDTPAPGMAYIPKPFTPASLGRTLRDVLDVS